MTPQTDAVTDGAPVVVTTDGSMHGSPDGSTAGSTAGSTDGSTDGSGP